MIKAIETRYAGCRFRSRLEARWAVFFDHLGIEWEYEPEGFETPDGPYLPDFRLEGSLWAEIKGGAPIQNDLNRTRHIPGLVILTGDIPRTPDGFTWLQYDECTRDNCMSTSDDHECTPGWNEWDWHQSWPFPGDNPHEPVVTAALATARSARFEHGESGPGPAGRS